MNERYEKVDEKTIRVITERPTDVTIAQLLSSKKENLKKLEDLKNHIARLEQVIEEARKLGLDVTEKVEPTMETK